MKSSSCLLAWEGHLGRALSRGVLRFTGSQQVELNRLFGVRFGVLGLGSLMGKARSRASAISHSATNARTCTMPHAHAKLPFNRCLRMGVYGTTWLENAQPFLQQSLPESLPIPAHLGKNMIGPWMKDRLILAASS